MIPKHTFFLFALILCVGHLTAQITFVNLAASGNNDGTSWTNAYTSLDTAILEAPANTEIWIAGGIYLASDTMPYRLDKNLTLRGGFSGTETTASEADPTNNFVILSGDVNGDDDPEDVSINREDNIQIMQVDSLLGPITITGIRFSGGQLGAAPPGVFINNYSGGAIVAYSPLLLENCMFSNNFADYGAAVALFSGTENSEFDSVMCTGNRANNRGIIATFNTANITVKNSTLAENITRQGGLYFFRSFGPVVDSCTFVSNTSLDRGAGVSFFFSEGARLKNSNFQDNNGGATGGALFITSEIGIASPTDMNDHRIENCSFTNNGGGVAGAGLLVSANALFKNNMVTDNQAGSFGGGFSIINSDTDTTTSPFPKLVRMESCSFARNRIGQSLFYGGALYLEQAIGLELDSCRFIENGGANHSVGGAIMVFGDVAGTQLDQHISITNSEFTDNQAERFPLGWGGAIYAQTDNGFIDLNIEKTEFNGNSASNLGGAIRHGSSVVVTLDEVTGQFNQAGNSGGFLFGFDSQTPFQTDPGNVKGSITVNNSVFNQNGANREGGVFTLNGIDLTAKNSQFYGNVLTADSLGGSGGVILANTDTSEQTIVLINNTFYANRASSGGEGDDVALFSTATNDVGQLNLVVQNNAFTSNNGRLNIGTVEVSNNDVNEIAILSSGGNFFAQAPTIPFPVGNDLIDENQDLGALFVDLGNFDLRLNQTTLSNPLINAGTPGSEVPVADFAENLRDNLPDIGAFEAALLTVAEIITNSGVHNELETYLNQAGLLTTLAEEGPYTVFAPVDDAFAALSPETVAALDETDNLENTLLTHVVEAFFPSSQITDGSTVASSAPGINLAFATDNGLTVTTTQAEVANIIVTDIPASNGMVHLIDAVLIPVLVAVRNLDAAGLDITFYPNPIQDRMNVRIDDSGVDEVQLKLFNQFGQQLQTWSCTMGNNIINFTHFPAGSYVLQLVIKGEVYSKKLMKQ